MSTGTIKFFNVTKGFGFITPEDGSTDLFVHITGLNEESYPQGQLPQEGDQVTYDVVEGQKGPMAGNVSKA
jgi:CspA family cold shock protein